MNGKQFRRFLDRDDGCVHCGELEAVSPHHRRNRGMGGSKARDVPSNIIVVCSWLNNAMEADAKIAEQARANGWKLQAGDHPALTPVFHYSQQWRLLADDYTYQRVIGQTEKGGL